MNTVVFFDLETTGLLDEKSDHWWGQPGITEFAAVRLDIAAKNSVTRAVFTRKEFSSLIDPEIAPDGWSEKAIEKTGITPDMVKDAPSLYGVAGDIWDLFSGARYLCGYNIIHFDIPVLQHQLNRYNLSAHFPWPFVHIDLIQHATQHMSLEARRGLKKPNLGELYTGLVNKPLDGAHRAINDVNALIEIFEALGGLEGLGYA